MAEEIEWRTFDACAAHVYLIEYGEYNDDTDIAEQWAEMLSGKWAGWRFETTCPEDDCCNEQTEPWFDRDGCKFCSDGLGVGIQHVAGARVTSRVEKVISS